MKICKKCGNLLSDVEYSCQKCGTAVDMAYVSNSGQVAQQQMVQQPMPQQMVQQPMQQMAPQQQMVQQPIQQQMAPQQMQPMIQPIQTQATKEKKKNSFSESLKKNYKPISIAIILLLIALSTYLVIDNIALRKKVKLNSTSAVESSYQIKDNTNNTGQVLINADEEEYNFEIPEGTYPKVSQGYVFFVDEDYVATVMEQSGGLSLLNLNTGGSGWVAVNRATLEGYRKQKDALKTTYETQGITVTKMYDQTINGKDALVLELMKDNQPTLLIITEATSGDCYILTVTNTNIKTSQDTTTANELMKMLSISQRLN